MPSIIVTEALILLSSFGQALGAVSPRIDGMWNGTFADSLQSGTILLTLEVVAEGSVQGTYKAAGATGRIRGTLKGKTFGFVLSQTAEECPATYVGNLSFENGRGSGSYSGTSCQGKHENGVLSLVRAGPSEEAVSVQADRASSSHDAGEVGHVDCGSLSEVTLLSNPSPLATVVSKLKCGERVEILGRENSYLRVRAGGNKEGFASRWFVSIAASTPKVISDTRLPHKPPEKVIQPVMWWFDEDGSKAGLEVMDIVITARAYDGVLEILRQYLGSKTTTYHPPTLPLAEWVDRQMTPETLASLLYWGDEVLDDTTPTMHFYLSKRAYQKTAEIIDEHFARLQTTASPQKKSKWGKFLEGLRAAAQGALAGAAYYYTVVQPSNQQTWELQRMNQQLNQIQWQLYSQTLQQQQRQERAQWNQWVRTLERYRTGRWP